jgi:DNA-binding Lrp family transcriptional regulator
MKLKLSENDKKVLRLLIEDGRMSRAEIGRKIGLTPQGVGKIQEKLEGLGVIKGYSTLVDYERLGIGVFAIAFFRLKSGSWSRLEKDDIRERVKGPHLIRVFLLPEGDVTHVVIYGFRSLKELDNYFHVLQTERGHISELKKLYILSSDSILKDSPNELLTKTLLEMNADRLARPEPPKPMPKEE